MKKILLLIMFLFGFLSCANAQEPDWSSFLPEDLIVDGMPVCPNFIPFVYYYSNEYKKIKLEEGKCGRLQFDEKTKEIFTEILVEEEGMRPYIDHQGYIYAGSYKNKHLVIAKFYTMESTGCFATIGLISRDGDYIINEGAFLTGDRAEAGVMKVDWIKDNILQFRFIQPYRYLYHYIDPSSSDAESQREACNKMGSAAGSEGFWSVVQVNLDDPEYEFHPKGIEFMERLHYEDFDVERAQFKAEQCFNYIAIEYIDSGRAQLNLKDSIAFTKEVTSCIQRDFILK